MTVYYDPKAIAPGTIRLDTSFDPYVETQPPAVQALRSGDAAGVVYRFTIQCVTDECLPLEKPKRLRFPAAVVTAVSGTRTVRASARWQPMYVTSRLGPAAASSGQHFRRPSTLLSPSYSIAPGWLEAVLVAAAVVLGACGLALLVLELRRVARRRRARLAGIQGRELALAFARESAARENAADRRKALGLLAETLAAEGDDELAASAGDVAWAEAPPTPDETLRLVEEVERAAPEEGATV